MKMWIKSIVIKNNLSGKVSINLKSRFHYWDINGIIISTNIPNRQEDLVMNVIRVC